MTGTEPAIERLVTDVVLLAVHDDVLSVLLIQRDGPPFEGRWAIPGGGVEDGEDTDAAARRELAEETGLTAPELVLVGVYSDPGRDPRGRYVAWAYAALLDHLPAPTAGDDARAARWARVDEVLADPESLAFDHHRIITDAVAAVAPTG